MKTNTNTSARYEVLRMTEVPEAVTVDGDSRESMWTAATPPPDGREYNVEWWIYDTATGDPADLDAGDGAVWVYDSTSETDANALCDELNNGLVA